MLLPTLFMPPLFLMLLRRTVRPVLIATAVCIPFSLFVCGWWALGASFEKPSLDDVDDNGQWWNTTGLRISAGILWLTAAGFGRLVWIRRKRLDRTATVVEVRDLSWLRREGLLFTAINQSTPHSSSTPHIDASPLGRFRGGLIALPHLVDSTRDNRLLETSERKHLGLCHTPIRRVAHLLCHPDLGLDMGSHKRSRTGGCRWRGRRVVLPQVSIS